MLRRASVQKDHSGIEKVVVSEEEQSVEHLDIGSDEEK